MGYFVGFNGIFMFLRDFLGFLDINHEVEIANKILKIS